MKKLVVAVALLVGATTFAQKSVATLKAEKAKKEAEIAKLQGEVGALKGQIDAYPGWKFGGMGTIGMNFAGFNNWFSNANANSSTGNIGIVVNGFANLDADGYFWRNSGTLNLGWTKLDKDTTDDETQEFEATTDVFKLNSLFGYEVATNLAASAMLEYRTTFIKNFNNPGYLDFGVGATWTPLKEFVMVVHPLNYNYVFSKSGSSYDSSMGCKVMAEYKRDFSGLKYRSNFTTFLSYSDIKNLSSWTWTNSLGFNLWKGIGVGLEAGLRQNKQEAFNDKDLRKANPEWKELRHSDNPLQSYWLVGLSYGF